MKREIRLHQDEVEILWSEFRFMLAYLARQGLTHCELVFGWPWGLEYPPDDPWGTLTLPLNQVEAEVQKPILAGLGTMGGDDIFVRDPHSDWEFLFCHHSGIHLSFETDDRVPTDFLKRWTDLGLGPIEREIVSGS